MYKCIMSVICQPGATNYSSVNAGRCLNVIISATENQTLIFDHIRHVSLFVSEEEKRLAEKPKARLTGR